MLPLPARSVESKIQVTLAGAEVSGDGKWKPGPPENIAIDEGVAVLAVPHASAAVIRLNQR